MFFYTHQLFQFLQLFFRVFCFSFRIGKESFCFCLLLTTSWSAFGLHWCRLDFDLTGGSWRCGWAHPIFDLGCHRHEGRFYVCSVLSRCLQEWNAQRISVFLKNIKIRESFVPIRTLNLMISAFYENVFYHCKSSLVWSEILPRGSFVIAFCSYVKFLFVINDNFFLEMKKSESQCFVGFFRISSLFFPWEHQLREQWTSIKGWMRKKESIRFFA